MWGVFLSIYWYNTSHMETREKGYIEKSVEKREAKEQEYDPELQAAARMERAEFLSKEVVQSQKQMKNIVRLMQQVKQAIQKIRALLKITDDTNTAASLTHDKNRVETLKKQIHEYQEEIRSMEKDLIDIREKEITKNMPHLSSEEQHAHAKEDVAKLIKGQEEK